MKNLSFDFSNFCSFDLLHNNLARHIQDIHGFESIEDAERISGDKDLLLAWQKPRGYTSIPGQCGFCGKTNIDQRLMKKHLENCTQAPGSRSNKLPDSRAETRVW